MSVMIRLTREGAKKHPQYRVVVVDKAKKRDGGYLASLGKYYPGAKEPKDKLKIDLDAVKGWVARGAQCSQTVGQLLKTLPK